MGKIKKYWFIIIFAFTMIIPICTMPIDNKIHLNGVKNDIVKVEANITTIGEGVFQTYLNDVWEDKFPGKKVLLRIRNQLLYSLLKVSPNSNVVIGKDGYLYEPSYILFETQIYPPSSEEYFESLGNKLHKLDQILNENGKELYVFITPSKAHFCKEYIPNSYMFLDKEKEYSYTNYTRLVDELDKNKIHYYDSVRFIEENVDAGILKSPLFYASGIHWSQPWGETCAANFLDYMNENSKYELGKVKVSESFSKTPIYPATDLYSSLNLILPTKDQWYSSEIVTINEGKDKPNVFLRGGSFMGQSLNALIRSDIFGKDVHFENNYYFTDKYSNTYNISNFTSYDELDLNQLVGQSDILVLEVNEGAIYTMSWGFIDYMIEHPEYLDYDVENNEIYSDYIDWMNSNIKIMDATTTEYNPWGFTAGMIDFENVGQCVFLTPNTSFEVSGLDGQDKIDIEAEIHPWVSDSSDGLGIIIWIMNEDGEILKENSVYIENTDEWKKINISLSDIEGASKIRVLCNNGQNNNDDADWAIFRISN